MSEWISVEDRFPDSLVRVIVFYNKKTEPTIAYYRSGKGVWELIGGGIAAVTHWMPLPKPPKE